jgi:surface polysaccharide O-acyltransferase-like enzyme
MPQVDPLPLTTVPLDGPLTPRQYLAYADVLRSVAAVLVVLAHAACSYLYVPHPPAVITMDWHAANWMLVLSRPCVPLFVMLSGLLLLNADAQPMSGKTFFHKRIMRVLVPLVLWSLAFAVWRLGFNGEKLSAIQLVDAFVQGTLSPHLWFLYMILAMYLLTPIIQVYVRSATWQDYRYFMGLWLCVSVLFPVFQRATQMNVSIVSFLSLNGFAGYYISGYFLNQVKVPAKWRGWLALLWAGGTIGTGVISAHLSMQAGKINDYFYSYLSPLVVVLSIALFLLLKDLPYARFQARYSWFYPVLKTFASLSLGVYLVHPMVMGVLESYRLGFSMTQLGIQPGILIPIYTGLVVLVALCVSAVLRKIPLIGKFLC